MIGTAIEHETGLEDLVCFSHLRWGFVFQRPQHLMSRFAKHRRVFFIEEAIREDCAEPHLRVQVCQTSRVIVVTPLIPPRKIRRPRLRR
jgi:UDP-galactopyranose mutase